MSFCLLDEFPHTPGFRIDPVRKRSGPCTVRDLSEECLVLGGGGVYRHLSTLDPNPPRHRPATAFRLPSRHHVCCTQTSLLQSDDTHASGAPHHRVTIHQKRRRTSRYINTWSVQRRPRLPYRIVDFRAAGWATTPCASGSSRPGPGNSGFLPTEHAPWKNRGLGKGRLACWQTSPVSGDLCAWAPWHGSGGGNSIASPRLLLPFDLTDLSHQSQGCSVIRTQSLGGRDPVVASARRATMGVKVLTSPFCVILRDRSARANPSPRSHGSLEWRLRRRLTSRPTLAK